MQRTLVSSTRSEAFTHSPPSPAQQLCSLCLSTATEQPSSVLAQAALQPPAKMPSATPRTACASTGGDSSSSQQQLPAQQPSSELPRFTSLRCIPQCPCSRSCSCGLDGLLRQPPHAPLVLLGVRSQQAGGLRVGGAGEVGVCEQGLDGGQDAANGVDRLPLVLRKRETRRRAADVAGQQAERAQQFCGGSAGML